MEFLNRAVAQLTDLFRSMTPGARIATALLLALVPISLAYLFTYRNSSADDYLLNGASLDPADMEVMQEAFGKANLSNFQVEGSKIRIPQGQKAVYLAALAANNALPVHFGEYFQKAMENVNPFISSKQREEMMLAAKQRELGLIIRNMRGIQDASVIYEPGLSPGFGQPATPTAQVSVKPKGSEQIGDDEAHAIRTLISRSIANLKAQDVAVIDLSSGTEIGHSDSESSAGASGGQYGDLKRRYEQEYKQKIREALSYVPGVTVTPNVDLDTEMNHHTETVKNDTKTVPLEVTNESHTSSSDAAGPSGGRPGPQSQGPNAPMQISGTTAKGAHQEEDTSKDRQLNVPTSRTIETLDKAPLTPKRVTVSIGVPASYFQKVWRERNSAAPGAAPKTPDPAAIDAIRQEETKNIREHVANLLPTLEGTGAAGQLVQVTTFQDIQPPPIAPPGAGENTVGWLVDNWSTLGMIALAFFGLWMLRSLVRSAAAPPRSEAAPAIQLAAGTAEEHEDEKEPETAKAGASRLRRFGTSGPSLRDELTQLVQEDPDAAANVLRTWIGATSNKT
jgi:flagellar M-ring protein FliF